MLQFPLRLNHFRRDDNEVLLFSVFRYVAAGEEASASGRVQVHTDEGQTKVKLREGAMGLRQAYAFPLQGETVHGEW